MPRPSQLSAVLVGAGLTYLAICSGCPVATTRPEPTPVPEGVSPLSLTHSPDAYKGKVVRVLLASRTYKTVDNGIVWTDGHPGHPLVLFVCSHRTTLEPLDIVGTCRGLSGRVVIVDACTVETIPRR